MHRKLKIFLIMICLLMGCSGCREKETSNIQLEKVDVKDTEEKIPEEKASIFVYVCGAVLHEGVYEMESGSRVYKAIEKAGGFKENAAVTYINQAEILEDEERLYIPTVEETLEQQMSGEMGTSEVGKINLNTAGKEELMTLPGIGEAKAESIIRYREEHGKLKAIEDIKQIEGIKDGVFEKIKDSITV